MKHLWSCVIDTHERKKTFLERETSILHFSALRTVRDKSSRQENQGPMRAHGKIRTSVPCTSCSHRLPPFFTPKLAVPPRIAMVAHTLEARQILFRTYF